MPWPVYLAFKQLFPTGRGLSVFAVLSILGVGLGVFLLVMVRSVMGGFSHEIERMIIDTQGEIRVRTQEPIGGSKAAAVERVLAGSPSVEAFAPYANGVVMLEYGNRPAFPSIQGFNYDQMKKVVPLSRYLVAGSLDDLDDDSVILSSILARSLGASVGDTVDLYSPLMLARLKRNEIMLPRSVRVAGIFQIGHQQLDSSTVLCSLRLMQDLYGLDRMVQGYNVRLRPGTNIEEAAIHLNQSLPEGTRALTWLEANAEFQAVVGFERSMITLLVGCIIVVAAFAITIALLMSVVRKTREIGLISAMGGSRRAVAACFCIQGLVIGVVGATCGVVVALVALAYRDAIVSGLNRLMMSREVFEQFYQFSSLPAYTRPGEVVAIFGFAVLAATLAGLLPAFRAAALRPVDALRSE
ncbi:MAG TPA: ABC transporter permease [Candidatus Didemnitutus sp.]|nr:ABC transporter permease [Candidatus Didemnitutus sp.]